MKNYLDKPTWIFLIFLIGILSCGTEETLLYNSWEMQSIEYLNCQEEADNGMLLFSTVPCASNSAPDCQYFVWEFRENGDAFQYQCFTTKKDTFNISFTEITNSRINVSFLNDTIQLDYLIDGDKLQLSGFDEAEACDLILKGQKI